MYRYLASVLLPLWLQAQPGTYSLDGLIFDAATRAPVAGARVRIGGESGEPVYARANAEGRFRIENLPPAHYYLRAEAPGYEPNTFSSLDLRPNLANQPEPKQCCDYRFVSGYSPGAFTRTTDVSGARRATIAIPLLAHAVISGRVVDPEGLPLQYYKVEILTEPRPGEVRREGDATYPMQSPVLTTDDRGEFRTARLPGTYYVAVNRPDAVGFWESHYRITYYPHSTDIKAAQRINLTPGQQVRLDLQIATASSARIAGRISFSDRGDLLRRSTRVLLVPANPDTPFSRGLVTEARDDYEFKDVPPGRYRLVAYFSATAIDAAGEDQRFYYGHIRDVEIGGADLTGEDIVLRPVGELHVSVIYKGCDPFPIRILPANELPVNSGASNSIVTSAAGEAVLRGLPPGRYRVLVSRVATGSDYQVQSMRIGDRDVTEHSFEFPLATNEPLRITLTCRSN